MILSGFVLAAAAGGTAVGFLPTGAYLLDRMAEIGPLPFVFIAAGCALLAMSFLTLRAYRSRQAKSGPVLASPAADWVSGPDAQEKLSQTMLFQIDEYRKEAGTRANQMAAINMAALAKEYAEAETSADRMKALQMLGELHGQVSGSVTPWWRDFEGLTARALTLATLGGGVLALIEGVQRLMTETPPQ